MTITAPHQLRISRVRTAGLEAFADRAHRADGALAQAAAPGDSRSRALNSLGTTRSGRVRCAALVIVGLGIDCRINFDALPPCKDLIKNGPIPSNQRFWMRSFLQ